MLEALATPQSLIYGAGAFYILGLAIINQVVLRLMVLCGTILYILYYAKVGDSPLWDPIYISTMIAAANIIGLTSLLARRSRLAIPADHADIYPQFPDLPPGDFRTLMKLARRRRVSEPFEMTREDCDGPRLYYVISGRVDAEKAGNHFPLPPHIFVGEVAYLLGRRSSATTRLAAGGELLEWDIATLRQRSARNARFKLALEAAISNDLARKVAVAVAPKPHVALDRAVL